MKDEIKENKLGRYSLYIGLSALAWWVIILLSSFMPSAGSNSDVLGIKNFFLGISASVQNIIGIVLGIIGLRKKNTAKKTAIFGILLNAPIFIIVVLFIVIPVIIVYSTGNAKRVPDQSEIISRFSEVLIEPTNIQGIEVWGNEGKALFKYHTQSKNFMEELQQKASAKGWNQILNKDSKIDFSKENQKSNGKSILYQYERLRIIHNNTSGLVCVGYNHILSFDKVVDFENNVDMKAIQFATWPLVENCAAGN